VAAPLTARAARPWPPLQFLRAQLAQWMRRRQGLDRLPVRLERRRLYILPTRAGLAYGALLLLMLLAGLNYSNSLTLFLTFLLVAFALVVMQLCHRNLLGTEVSALLPAPVFAGGQGRVLLTLGNRAAEPRRRLEAILPRGTAVSADVPSGAQRRLELLLAAPRRGVLHIERIKIATAHPFGLFRAWTWVHTPIEMLVYPQPRGSLPLPVESGGRPGLRAAPNAGGDEWAGLRHFRDGDSPRQVDWKAYAREAPLLVKEYLQGSAELRWLDFTQLAGTDTEAKLAQLSRWVVSGEASGERYGLLLPGTALAPDRGPEHRHRCLAALALYPADER
jgi:uncharacterized protein (DUF58 family)